MALSPTTSGVREWRTAAPAWGRELWVEDPSGVTFGFQLGDVTQLAEMKIPANICDDRLRAVLARTVDQESWGADLVAGRDPAGTPVVSPPLRRLVVLAAADELFGKEVVPAVLELDRALAWDELGERPAALGAVRASSFTAMEVTELLLDVGVGDAYRADLQRLLDLLIEAGVNAEETAPLRADLTRPLDTEWDYRPDAADYPFRAELRRTETSALLAGEAAAKELRDLIHAPDTLSENDLLERGRAESWRTARLKLAVEQIPGRTGSEEKQLFDGEADPTAIDKLCREIGAVAIQHATANPERVSAPAPLLCEVVHALLGMRAELRGGLERAVERDGSDGG